MDVKNRHLNEIKESRFRIVIRDAALDTYMAGKSPKGETIRNVHVTFGEGSSLMVKAERVVSGETVPISAAGTLMIRDPQHAGVDLNKLSVTDTPVTGLELELVRSRLESAMDLTRLPLGITLTRISTSQGTLTLEGMADLTESARQKWSRRN